MGGSPDWSPVPKSDANGVNHLKQQARELAESEGIPYTRALARLQALRTDLDDTPGGRVPAPIAVLMARQLNAAFLHLSAFGQLSDEYGVTKASHGIDDEDTSPLAQARTHTSRVLIALSKWAARTAYASGAVTALPDMLATDGAGAAARDALFPDGAWCRDPQGRMPQPGEQVPEHEGVRLRVRTNLVGPVPQQRFSARFDRNPALPAVDGTPAAAVWRAYRELNRYAFQGWARPGDSAADLAATLDGLQELAEEFARVTTAVLGEIEQRLADGRLAGVDAAGFRDAIAETRDVPADDGLGGHYAGPAYGTVSALLQQARALLVGARSALPPGAAPNPRAAGILARLDGASLTDVREKLGEELHLVKQLARTGSADYTRCDALARALQWMHAADAVTYDHRQHLVDEQRLAAATSP